MDRYKNSVRINATYIARKFLHVCDVKSNKLLDIITVL